MRIFHIQPGGPTETADLDALIRLGPPAQGFIWVACARREFEVE